MKPLNLCFVFLLFVPLPACAADDELKAMVRELGSQVRQLTQRVADLESELEKERQARGEAEKPEDQANSGATGGPAEQPRENPSGTGTGPAAASKAEKLSRWSTIKPHSGGTPAEPGRNVEAAKPEARPVLAGDVKGSINIPGTDTSLAIGGYAKLDAIYSSVGSGSNNFGDQFLVLSAIPVGAARVAQSSQTTFQAKETRFWIKSLTPSAWGDISTYAELDWFGSPDSYTPRLRHAFGTLGGFLAGQTWSTMLNVSAIPETLDIGGSVGIGLVRQPMIRWNQPFDVAGESLEFQAALEAPNTRLAMQGSPAIVSPNENRYPDLIARLNYNPSWGGLSLAAAGRQIRYAPAVGPALVQWGGALSMAGKIKTFGQDNIRFTLSYGNAFGRYASYNAFADAVLDSRGRLMVLADNFSAMLSYQHWWSGRWRSTLAYGFAQSDLPYFANGGLTRQGQSAHLNVLWSPFVQTTFGLEYIFATRSLESGPYGDLNRFEFSSRFSF